MSIVWLTSDLDEPARSGGQIRAARLLAGLAERASVEVVLFGNEPDRVAVQRRTGAGAVAQIRLPKEPVRRRLRALGRALPLRSATVYRGSHSRALDERLRESELVIVDHLQMAPFLKHVRRGVLNLHNADAQLVASSPPPAEPLRRLEHEWDKWTTQRLERWAVRRATAVVCVSEIDAESVGAQGAVVVPNGADLPSSVTSPPVGGDLVFVGSLDYAPNEEAIRWWLREVVPWLPPDLPGLTVVGRSAARVLADVADHPRISIRSDVPSVVPYLQRASVVVQPLRRGGGSRLKLVEALGQGRPVVTTSAGAAGFPVVHGEHVLLADDARSMASAVASLYTDAEQARRLAEAGRVFARDYDWQVLGRRFADAMLQLTNQ